MQKLKMSQVRIIGGKWRGRKIIFPAVTQLRPTPDRVRETLFNWLAPYVQDADCLDLFAGSGVLGFEALSRGAKSVVMIDRSSEVIEMLKKNAAMLTIENIEIYCSECPPRLTQLQNRRFDIIFLDPPFYHEMIKPCATWLEQNNLLNANALVYIETESSLKQLPLPENWKILRSKIAGQVGYHLVVRNE